jgi:hypothetical protein
MNWKNILGAVIPIVEELVQTYGPEVIAWLEGELATLKQKYAVK